MSIEDYEMPTPCTHCGYIFDLNDGVASDKWYVNTTICTKCGEKEEEEIRLDRIVEDANTELNDALQAFDEYAIWDKISLENRELIIKHIAI